MSTTGWSLAEEQLIAAAMVDGLGRSEAIRRLRSSWLIGETPPPMSREGRKMPHIEDEGMAQLDGLGEESPGREDLEDLVGTRPGSGEPLDHCLSHVRPPWSRFDQSGR